MVSYEKKKEVVVTESDVGDGIPDKHWDKKRSIR